MPVSSPVYDPEKEKVQKPDGSHDKREMTDDERRAEIDQLEQAYAAPSADSDSSGISADKIAEAEKSGAAPDDSGQLGKGYTGGKPARRSIVGRVSGWSGRKKILGGGFLAAIIAGIISLSSLVTGPLQFIHIAQLLERFHFASAQDDGNSRILKLYKWSKNARAGTIENTRLGVVGRRIATKVDSRLAEIGIEKQYSRLGTYEGTAIDMKSFSENSENGAGFKGLGEEETINKFKSDFGINLQFDEQLGKYKVNEKGFFSAYFKNRALNKMIVREAGYDNIGATVAARIMGTRDKVPWHPIERLDSKITGAIDKKFTAWLSKLKDRIKNGETPKLESTGSTDATDANGNPDEKARADTESAAKSTDDLARQAAEADEHLAEEIGSGAKSADDVSSGVIKSLTESKAGKIGLSATAVVGLACAAQGISKAAAGLKHDLVVLPLVRSGMQAISLGNQVMSGQDLDITQLGFFAKQLNDPKSGSWATARSIQSELGQPLTGLDIPDAANVGKIGSNMFSDLFESVPGLSAVCQATNSALGGLAMTVVGAVTSPVGTIGQEIVTKSGVLEGPITSLVHWMAGSPIPAFVTGPTYGNYINFGAKLAANDQFASMGGAVLSGAQAAEIKNYNIAAQRQELQNQPLAQRLLDPYSSDSLVGKAIDNVAPDPSSNIASFLAGIASPSKFLAIFKMPFNQKISAAGSYDYGFPTIGFSMSDLNSDKYDNPYTNASRAISLLRRNDNNYRSRLEKCFGVTFDSASQDGTLTTEFNSIDVLKHDYNKNHCDDPSTDWTSVRFYVLDMKTLEATDCFETGDNQSCQNTGFGSATSTTTDSNSTVGSISGYKNPFRSITGLTPQRIDQGVDYAGTGPIYAIGNATVIDANPHSQWPDGNWISYQLEDGPAAGKVVFFAEDCTVKVTSGQHITPDTVICDMFRGSKGIEIGWAEPGLGEHALAHNIYHEGLSTQLGVNFSDFLKKLGAPGGHLTNDVSNVPIPAGWPTW